MLFRSYLVKGEKPLDWIGSSKKDFLAFPKPVQAEFGYALGLAQLGKSHPSAKAWKGEGPGVLELVETFDGDAFRAIYTVRFRDVVYMLHAFQKKSPRGGLSRSIASSLARSKSQFENRPARSRLTVTS